MLSTTTTPAPSLSSALSSNAATKMMTKCHHLHQRHHPQRCQMQHQHQHHRHNGISSLSLSPSSSFYGLNKWLWTAVLFGLLIVTATAIDENSKSSTGITAASSSNLSPRDEIYIDDERLDGSGRGGIHDDLEKDHDFSGSGFGPDDEDSDSDYRHHSHKHQTGKSNINKNIDDNEFITSRNNQNQNQNIHQISSSNSGLNNQGNNQGIISSGGSSATSGNTGLNTIDNTNNNQQNQGKTITPETNINHHDDDFDIVEGEEEEGGILAGSGDGGLIDHDNDDDDHTGDVDADGGDLLPDITKYQHGIFNSPTNADKNDHKPPSSTHNDDFEEEHEFDHHQPIDHDDEDDGDDLDHDEEDVTKHHKTHSEDGTEMYTDVSDETTNTGSSSSSTHSSTTEKRPGGINTQGGTNIHDLDTNSINSLPPDTKIIEQTTGNEVLIMNANDDDRTASFFAQPGILAAVIGGAVVGLLCAILVVMFIVYRMRKKDEGSYALDEPKRSPAMNSYAKNATNREFYA